MAPSVGFQVGDDKVSNCLFVDDLTLITENAQDLQCAINIVEMFCLAFGIKINVLLLMNNNKRPLTPKSMPPAGDEHAKLKT